MTKQSKYQLVFVVLAILAFCYGEYRLHTNTHPPAQSAKGEYFPPSE